MEKEDPFIKLLEYFVDDLINIYKKKSEDLILHLPCALPQKKNDVFSPPSV